MADDAFDIDPEALARAEAALSALSDDYLRWAESDLARLGAAMAALRAAAPAQWPAAIAAVFAIAHDIKGQATTFGYPLLTRLGATLCRQLRQASTENAAAGDAAVLADLEAVVAAMAEIIALRLSGDSGGDLVARLAAQGIRLIPEG